MSAYSPFKFSLTASVCIVASGQNGVVVARAECIDASPSYLVLYATPDGDAKQEWWSQSSLDHAFPDDVTGEEA